MKNMMCSATVILLAALCLLQAPAAHAACIDVLLPGELPGETITPGGVTLTYSYEFSTKETYSLAWDTGTAGPFALGPGCKVGTLYGESAAFLLLESGCGTFCWYVDVLRLAPPTDATTSRHEQIQRPLVFDAQRNLLAHYAEQDVIAVRNLDTGQEQRIPTAQACSYFSGLCFSEVAFTQDSLEYRWESGTLLSHRLDAALLSRPSPTPPR